MCEIKESFLKTIILIIFVYVFLQHPEFSFLLKERLCPLIIKLFSPSIKQRASSSPLEKPLYPVAVRLLRIVSVLIEKFYTLLVRFGATHVHGFAQTIFISLFCVQKKKKNTSPVFRHLEYVPPKLFGHSQEHCCFLKLWQQSFVIIMFLIQWIVRA